MLYYKQGDFMIKTGIDIVYVPRIKKVVEKDVIMKKIFTLNETNYFENKNYSLDTIAGTYASKEAFIKALHLDITKVDLHDIEVIHDQDGIPHLVLHNDLLDLVKNQNINLSISHDGDYATAIVIIYP